MSISFNTQPPAQRNYGVGNAGKQQVGFGAISKSTLDKITRGTIVTFDETMINGAKKGKWSHCGEAVVLQKLKDSVKLLSTSMLGNSVASPGFFSSKVNINTNAILLKEIIPNDAFMKEFSTRLNQIHLD